jgi:glycosyltransferase involved in cell wall biosynthesis
VEAPGFVNFEAGACSCPSVTTIETGIWDWTDGGGVLIPVSVEALRAALKQVLGWSVDERAERGRRSRRLVEERYSWQALTPRWGSVYQAVAEGRPAEL